MANKHTTLVIKDVRSGKILVDAQSEHFAEIEGNWYVDPSAVRTDVLQMTQHEYTCPYKGRCHYVDFADGSERQQRVAWVYDDVKPGWEHIRGKYAFYAGATARKFGKTLDEVI